MFAAVLYAVNPYHLVIVYWRSAFAELLASCLVPLLLLFVSEGGGAGKENGAAVVPLSLVLAAAWLTNAPAAVMIHYSLALLVVFFAWRQRSARLLMVGAGAVALGACLAAFYLLPAIYEQRWIDIAEAVSQDRGLRITFYSSTPATRIMMRSTAIVSWVAVWRLFRRLCGGVGGAAWRETSRRGSLECAAGMGDRVQRADVSDDGVLWRVLPKLQFMQFPWRWLLCLSMIFTFSLRFLSPRRCGASGGGRRFVRFQFCRL